MIVKLQKVILVKVMKNSFVNPAGESIDFAKARLVDEDVNVIDVSVDPILLPKVEKAIKLEGDALLSIDNQTKGFRVRLVGFEE